MSSSCSSRQAAAASRAPRAGHGECVDASRIPPPRHSVPRRYALIRQRKKKTTLPSVGSDPEKRFSRHGEHGPNCSLHRSVLIAERGKQRTERDARPAARRRNAAWNSVWGTAAQLKASRLPCALRPEQRRSRHRPAAAPPLSAPPECVSCPARCSLLSHPRVNAAPRAGESSPRSGRALPVTALQHR